MKAVLHLSMVEPGVRCVQFNNKRLNKFRALIARDKDKKWVITIQERDGKLYVPIDRIRVGNRDNALAEAGRLLSEWQGIHIRGES